MLGNLFELEDLGAKDLKGIARPVRAWAALRPASVESRFEALHTSGLTELVGREEELEISLRRWSRAKSGEGQVVLLSGEPGIGKSRLTAALLERVAPEPHTRLRYFCSPQRTDSALFPIISQMERAARFAHDDTVQVKLDKLDALLAQSSTPREDAALFVEMLSLPNDGRYPGLEMAPPQRRQKTLEALTAQIVALAQSNPVLMIFEDVHWVDPTSLEAFSRAVDRVRTLGVLLIVTYRPEFEAPWIGQPHVTALTVNRLGQREIAAIIDRLAGNKPLSASIRQEIIERTDGVPLFVEEMTKAVLEAAGEGAAERGLAAIPSSAVAVPASLHASLMARLDRLGSAKEVAQIGAAIGREFTHSLLAAVVAEPEAELQSALDRLVTAGLLFRQGIPPHANYLFKHALVQDAAYGTLLRGPRRALHARIAGTLEDQFAGIAENQPELLARHCTEAGLIEKAAWLWGKAGEGSLARSAVLLKPASSSSGHSTRSRPWRKHRAYVGNSSSSRSPSQTPSCRLKAMQHPNPSWPSSRRACSWSELKPSARLLRTRCCCFRCLGRLECGNYVKFNGEAIKSLASQFMALAERQGTTTPLMVGHRLIGMSALHTGDIGGSRQHFDCAIALYDPAEHRALAPRFGQDIRVAALSFRARTLWLLGYPALALADIGSALRMR